ncbi:MAG: endonuclease/exonuclease/phosphatase family protein, partial [Pseudomonadota bacterium]
MRVTSYNIRKAVGLDWRRDAGRIVDVLGEIDADVVVLQEADKRLGARAG